MNQKNLSVWLKALIVSVGVCGLIAYLVVLPGCLDALGESCPEFSGRRWIWTIFIWLSAAPCYATLALGWRIATRIGEDRSFSLENAKALSGISWLAAGDAAYFFLGNLTLWLLGMNHPGVLLLSLLICFVGVAVTVAAACLSHLTRKAADLQEQSDLTV